MWLFGGRVISRVMFLGQEDLRATLCLFSHSLVYFTKPSCLDFFGADSFGFTVGFDGTRSPPVAF